MTTDEHIKNLEDLKEIDPKCKTCLEIFYPQYKKGNFLVFAPHHKPSSRCESSKHPHCACDICF